MLNEPNSSFHAAVLNNKEDLFIHEYFGRARPFVIKGPDSSKGTLTLDQKERRNSIWISLMFRMLC
jgi:hypothetical protein